MASVDPRDMLNKFCFHVYAQKISSWARGPLFHSLLATCQLELATCQRIDLQELATCNLQLSICNLQLATCNLQLATCNLQLATCNLQFATCNLQLAICNLQPLTCNLHGAGGPGGGGGGGIRLIYLVPWNRGLKSTINWNALTSNAMQTICWDVGWL